MISLAREGNNNVRLGYPKAMALYETSVRIDPNNYRAANELGVLLIRYGQPRVAIPFLEQSVRVVPSIEGWHNLSVAQNAVGNDRLFHQAAMQRDALKQQEEASGSSFQPAGMKIRWVDSETFAAKSPPDTAPAKSTSSGMPIEGHVADRMAGEQGRTDKPLTSTASGFDRIKSGLRSIIR